MLKKIAGEQFINALPQELRIWVASHSPETPTAVAKLIESYDSAHSTTGSKVNTRRQDYKPQWKSVANDSLKQGKSKKEGPPKSMQRLFMCRRRQGRAIRVCSRKEKLTESQLGEFSSTVEHPEL